MERQQEKKGLRAYLKGISDPRRRQGRIYPLEGVLTMLILAAVNGEKSLRGTWIWAREQWRQIRSGVGMEWLTHPPEYGTLGHILASLSLTEWEMTLWRWAKKREGELSA